MGVKTNITVKITSTQNLSSIRDKKTRKLIEFLKNSEVNRGQSKDN